MATLLALTCTACRLVRPAHLIEADGRCALCSERQGQRPGPRHNKVQAQADAWRQEAACRQSDVALFFPDPADFAGMARARVICDGCPVRRPCLAAALAGNEVGVWAGTTEDERHGRRRRRAG